MMPSAELTNAFRRYFDFRAPHFKNLTNSAAKSTRPIDRITCPNPKSEWDLISPVVLLRLRGGLRLLLG